MNYQVDVKTLKKEITEKEEKILNIKEKIKNLKVQKKTNEILTGCWTLISLIKAFQFGKVNSDTQLFSLGLSLFILIVSNYNRIKSENELIKINEENLKLMSDIEARKVLIKSLNCNQ